eukprot:m.593203 g.593203  ORF g.593203 m.593203 type:complete len:555 (+) comp22392_c0_seq4:845-2509(+)
MIRRRLHSLVADMLLGKHTGHVPRGRGRRRKRTRPTLGLASAARGAASTRTPAGLKVRGPQIRRRGTTATSSCSRGRTGRCTKVRGRSTSGGPRAMTCQRSLRAMRALLLWLLAVSLCVSDPHPPTRSWCAVASIVHTCAVRLLQCVREGGRFNPNSEQRLLCHPRVARRVWLPQAPGPDGGARQRTMMLTSDISLLHDPTGAYQEVVRSYAEDAKTFDNSFAHAWYKLTTRDMGPVTRCLGDMTPPAQPWQFPLPPPPPPASLANFTRVREEVASIDPAYRPLLVRLAWRCAGTFRSTDYLGGCNGARVRFSPEVDWPVNAGLDVALAVLEPIKSRYADGLSWADLIVLAGTKALELSGAPSLPFCGGRTDATTGVGAAFLEPIGVSGAFDDSNVDLRESFKISGLSDREMVALIGGGHSLGGMHVDTSGFQGSWTTDPTSIDNAYFKGLFTESWEVFTVAASGQKQYKARGKDSLFMLKTDMWIRFDPELAAAGEEFAADNRVFLDVFATAWTKLMNADRFDGPGNNLCDSSALQEPVRDSSTATEIARAQM